jgi:hypothetical protein
MMFPTNLRRRSLTVICVLAWSVLGAHSSAAHADRPAAEKADPASRVVQGDAKDAKTGKERLKKLADNLWIDLDNKWVILDGEVCMRKGPPLELFACLKGTKEHESIVAVEVKAYQVHAALLSVGAKPGKAVQFQPKYVAATGPEIEILVLWTDAEGKRHKARAQDWIRDIKTQKAMTHPWVFAGSGFWMDPASGDRTYLAEGGELICVSNFPSAMLDLPVESSQSTDLLGFEAFTENIPPEETKVRLILMPKIEKAKDKDKDKDKPAAKPATGR